ncbi:MAG: hypothetical protein QW063_00965 [Candidatus Nanoarchaeia archaeon]
MVIKPYAAIVNKITNPPRPIKAIGIPNSTAYPDSRTMLQKLVHTPVGA